MTNLLQVEFLEEHENPFQMVTPRHNLLMVEGETRSGEEVGDNVNGTCDEASDRLVTWTQQILPV